MLLNAFILYCWLRQWTVSKMSVVTATVYNRRNPLNLRRRFWFLQDLLWLHEFKAGQQNCTLSPLDTAITPISEN
jgi:hypothetical protein